MDKTRTRRLTMTRVLTINIWDYGCGVVAELEGGSLRVIQSGGCPVEEILGHVRPFANRQKVARAVLNKWLRGYDGGRSAARASHLYVDVDGQRIYA